MIIFLTLKKLHTGVYKTYVLVVIEVGKDVIYTAIYIIRIRKMCVGRQTLLPVAFISKLIMKQLLCWLCYANHPYYF
jgi:hypothetical protein